jgi:isocitrate dehydrogenase kinase/phosphatase
MFKPCENANELFRRLHSQVFEFKMERGHIEKLKFGDVVEVQAVSSDIPEVIFVFYLHF